MTECLLCGHEGHDPDGETDNHGDWYCGVCVDTAPSIELPVTANGETSDTSIVE